MGRMPGWIANWKEIHDDPKSRIYRPRQVYTGQTLHDYVPIDQR
jgi:citrate synthase